MSRVKQQFSYYQRSMPELVAEAKNNLRWVTLLSKHRGCLNRIARIVRLGCLGTEFRTDYSHGYPYLPLDYCGTCKSHLDALVDLRRIEQALRCEFGECHLVGGGDTMPSGRYEGLGKIGHTTVHIELRVPWIPCGCEVRVEKLTEWSRGPGLRRYNVRCNV